MLMWFLDISGRAFNDRLRRRFYIDKTCYYCHNAKNRLRSQEWYVVRESWSTLDSRGDTDDFDYYAFSNDLDTRVFIADLVMKLNTPAQRRILHAAFTSLSYMRRAPDVHQKIRQQKLEGRQMKQRQEQTERRQAQEERLRRQTKCVYVSLLSIGTVKIGVSNNVVRRIQEISHASGLQVVKYCYTKPLPVDLAFSVELICHNHFHESRMEGEFFQIEYETVCNFLKSVNSETRHLQYNK